VQTLQELLDHEFRALAALEHRLAAVLQDLADESANKEVRKVFLRQQRQARKALQRLQRVAGHLRLPPAEPGTHAPVVEGLLREKEALVAGAPTDELLDYYNLQLAVRLTQAAAAAYEGVVETAERLQVLRVAQGLRANLEEKRTLLSDLAAQTRAFAVTFRQTGGVLQPLPPARREQARALVGNGVR
jgi:ferritin-like metal-binding protein YciE